MSAPPAPVRTAWTTGWTDVLNTGTWRAALPVHEWRPSPCHVRCPVEGEIPTWIKKTAEGDYLGAWQILVKHNPLPAVTGRVCHHPCESDCNRAVLEAAVGINGLEHFLGDYALEQGWALPAPGASQGKRVAIVGGGPAGLSAAYHLRVLGYDVTLFEARAELGGTLRSGIPAYRLSKGVLDAEIARLLELGIDTRLSAPVADAAALAELEAEFDAVFVAIGAQRAKRLAHVADGPASDRVLDGLEFLESTNSARAAHATPGAYTSPELAARLGAQVIVIGGGSAAMDVARSARRLGKAVTIICLEARDDMPAQEEEVLEAHEEGIGLIDRGMVNSVDATGDRLILRCRKVTLDPHAPAGELRPVPVPGGEFSLAGDSIIVAIGQNPALDGLSTVLAVDRSIIRTDAATLATERSGVFAGGDVASAVRYVSEAIGAGERAARGIAAYLGHPEVGVAGPRPATDDAVKETEVNPYYFPDAQRTERERLPVAARVEDFREIAQTLTASAAAQEAARCMSCGQCVECDNCFIFCPDMAIARAVDAAAIEPSAAGRSAGGRAADPPDPRAAAPHYLVLDQYCKGCGLCVTECPRGAVRLTEEVR